MVGRIELWLPAAPEADPTRNEAAEEEEEEEEDDDDAVDV